MEKKFLIAIYLLLVIYTVIDLFRYFRYNKVPSNISAFVMTVHLIALVIALITLIGSLLIN